ATDTAEDTSARAVYHVVPRDDGWAVQKEGNERATSLHTSKNEALKAGREVATNQAPSRLVVHKADGTIQTSYTYDTEA
ncbi:MAG: DUF2188 domain-containing protein, partial [Rhodothermales bacterium]|nr:DUF2188 domain-containing protein [Rhodothermales bacterium]